MKLIVNVLFITLAVALTMGCHKSPPPVRYEYNTFKISKFFGKPHSDLLIYRFNYDNNSKELISSNNVYTGQDVLNTISAYGWELVTIDHDEFYVKRPRNFDDTIFFVFPGKISTNDFPK